MSLGISLSVIVVLGKSKTSSWGWWVECTTRIQ